MTFAKYPIEIAIAGIYFPPLFFATILGVIMSWLISKTMNHYDIIRFVWHPPLFYVALAIICTGIVSVILIPV